MSSSKGSRAERELRDNFYEWGGVALRVPASGSATEKSLPDILGAFDQEQYAIELKYSSGKRARFQKEEARKLYDFCELWGATPLFVARFSQDTSFYALSFDSWEEVKSLNDFDSFAIKRTERDDYPALISLISSSATDW